MDRSPLARIAALSALVLFVEMLLIRWVATELRIFAYLQNGVLVAAFLGLGLGFRRSADRARLLPAVAALALIALVIRDPVGWNVQEALTQGLTAFEDSLVWDSTWGTEGAGEYSYVRLPLISFALVVTCLLLGAVAAVFEPMGRILGRWIAAHERPISAYSANILGSIAGIAVFDAATIARLPPWTWLAAAAAGIALTLAVSDDHGWQRWSAAALALALPLLALPAGGSHVLWSPYQKLVVHEPGTATRSGVVADCVTRIDVNNSSYQVIVDLDPATWARDPASYPPGDIQVSHYVLPYELVGPRRSALVVGSGAGNDVAAALRAGVESVHAVEIDPGIVDIGRDMHPNDPYGSPRVRLTVDDARAAFRRDEGSYDLVWFGLLDSHTTPSAYTNVRLDHFVYTEESLAEVRRLLAPGGVVVVYFQAMQWWIGDRFAVLLRDAFGTPPIAVAPPRTSECLGWTSGVFIAGDAEALAGVLERARAIPALEGRVQDVSSWPLETRAATDDWPYIYLQGPSIPKYHLAIAFGCAVLAFVLRRRLFRTGGEPSLLMALLGAGFMLLEVSGVSRAALLFGTTWTVNAYVIAAILAMVLLANAVASRFAPDPAGWPSAGLLASLAALALVPASVLVALPLVPRIIVAGAFIASPVFFSGLVFVRAWSRSERRDLALSSNLLGSLVGGVAGMLSMVIGFRALSWLTLAVYLAAVLVLRRDTSANASASAVEAVTQG